jgi:OsmC-like protein
VAGPATPCLTTASWTSTCSRRRRWAGRAGRPTPSSQGTDTGDSTVEADVTIGTIPGGGYGLAVALRVSIPGVEPETVRALAEAAHQVCPYSNATRGNIDVTLTANGHAVG